MCLFPTRKECEQLNEQILACLDCPKKELFCLDEVDDTKSSNKWYKWYKWYIIHGYFKHLIHFFRYANFLK